ncbi:hypothetical protein CBP51_17460 [Cellvibrio mixtus]|uniref:Mannose-6-phosphate isomerase n=1 Tax=Cellvibrio mixtus TaxID=39650 RepID=A0A266Q5Q8_9GAMM|nr:hypothetical protein [Cellvibrio mixtus]OZY84946.1 hypothetical protein CBP51_17460 [Cellvibrio mixtus]
MILHTLDNNTAPEVCLSGHVEAWQESAQEQAVDIFALRFVHHATYLAEKSQQTLLALVTIQSRNTQSTVPDVHVSIFPCTEARIRELESLPATVESAVCYCQQQAFPRVLISAPLFLSPVHVPKPWGQEVWYTGIEARGQAEVIGEGGNLPLPWVLEFLRHRLALGDAGQLILLKVLDPLADECYGDLYFELHEQKQEVYVVTHVDQQAWPDGRGAIQLGFDPAIRARYTTNEAFKLAYGVAVSDYEKVRRAIDDLLDHKKREQGIALDQPIAACQLRLWMNELAQDAEYKALVDREKILKQVMDGFVALHPLAVGDVVAVPRLVPHALQHGVRVVEFQTPVYERKILSFGQKVLTQKHWDTAAALNLVDMDSALLVPPTVLCHSEALQVQRIVNFEDFEVRRIRLCGEYTLEFDHYCLLMVLEGEVGIHSIAGCTRLANGDVTLIVADAFPHQIESSSGLLLQAIPRVA